MLAPETCSDERPLNTGLYTHWFMRHRISRWFEPYPLGSRPQRGGFNRPWAGDCVAQSEQAGSVGCCL